MTLNRWCVLVYIHNNTHTHNPTSYIKVRKSNIHYTLSIHNPSKSRILLGEKR